MRMANLSANRMVLWWGRIIERRTLRCELAHSTTGIGQADGGTCLAPRRSLWHCALETEALGPPCSRVPTALRQLRSAAARPCASILLAAPSGRPRGYQRRRQDRRPICRPRSQPYPASLANPAANRRHTWPGRAQRTPAGAAAQAMGGRGDALAMERRRTCGSKNERSGCLICQVCGSAGSAQAER
jgi:hypothetical protein